MKKIAITTLILTLFSAFSFAANKPSLPKGYEKWKKSQKKLVTDKSSLFYGVHYIYADEKGFKGYKNGNRFEEGSRIVVEHFNIKSGSNDQQGSKNMIVMMKKDKSQKNTGGWLFAGFGADKKLSPLDPQSTCFGCHQKDAASKDFVISTIKDFAL